VSYRWIEHTAELELEIEAPTEEAVFGDALEALAELLGPAAGPEAHHTIELNGADRGALLADWLEELVFLAETEDFFPERLESIELALDALKTVVAGQRGTPPHLVKAVTYHRLELRPDNGNWRARVVLDV
jgi:protein archease